MGNNRLSFSCVGSSPPSPCQATFCIPRRGEGFGRRAGIEGGECFCISLPFACFGICYTPIYDMMYGTSGLDSLVLSQNVSLLAKN